MYLKSLWYLLKNPPHPAVIINFIRYFINSKFPNKIHLKHTPTSIVLYTTRRCNLSCDFCYLGDDLNPSNHAEFELEPEHYDKFRKSKYFRNALRIGLLGGEPFISKHVFDILADLKKQGKITTVVTNSMLLKGEKLEKLKQVAPVALGLSLYENNKQDIERVNKEMESYSTIWIQKIISADNLREIEESIKFCLSIGAKNLKLSNYYPSGSEDEHKVVFDDNINFPSCKKYIEETYGDKIRINWFKPISRVVTNKSCMMPKSYIHLDNNGAIGPCLMRVPNEEKYGNIYSEEGWNHPGTLELRKDMTDNSICNDICRFCESLEDDLYKI